MNSQRRRRLVKTRAVTYERVYPDLRRGQALYNALRNTDPILAEVIHGTEADPFYDDARIPAFWGAL